MDETMGIIKASRAESAWAVSPAVGPAHHTAGLLARFDRISLSELARVSLLNRVDTKYVFDMSQLYDALRGAMGCYRALEVERVRLSHYHTVYFDTPDFGLYHQHHNGVGTRYKVRERQYVDSDLAFLEVKHKTNQGRTIKSRLQILEVETDLGRQAGRFIDSHTHTPLDERDLEPKLWNDYLRLTLVSTCRLERLTIDTNLSFGWRDIRVSLPGVAIAEVKQERFSYQSDFIRQMRLLGIQPTSFSKYCVGASLLYDGLKSNNFKRHVRLLEKVMGREPVYEYLH
jgi:hypothetical protein